MLHPLDATPIPWRNPRHRLPPGPGLRPTTGVYDAADGTVTWTFGLAPGATATFAYEVEVRTDEGTIADSATWVERDPTGRTENPVEPGITEEITDKPPAGG